MYVNCFLFHYSEFGTRVLLPQGVQSKTATADSVCWHGNMYGGGGGGGGGHKMYPLVSKYWRTLSGFCPKTAEKFFQTMKHLISAV